MNSPYYLAEIRRERARAEEQRKRDARRTNMIETIIAALLAVLIGLSAV